MMMKIDVDIERISNGFIITGNDSTRVKQYFPSLGRFLEAWVLEPIQDTDKYFIEHETNGEKRRFKLEIEAIEPGHDW